MSESRRISYLASAPGSLMLLGEYAVLHDSHALVAAIDKRISVSLTARADDIIRIKSSIGNHQATLATIKVIKPFEFVISLIESFNSKLQTGFDLVIDSEISPVVGFGTSAAVTVACCAAIVAYLDLNFDELTLIEYVRNIIRKVQGAASGADVAASVIGGVVAYRQYPLSYEVLNENIPLTVIYSGYKTKTKDAIAIINKKFFNHKKVYQNIIKQISECVQTAIVALKKNNLTILGNIMNQQQDYMRKLGVSDNILDKLIAELNVNPKIYGAKISGSGLGDCVIGLGRVDDKYQGEQSVMISVSGVSVEKN